MPPPRTFNPNVNYQIRQEGGRFIVINRDRNRRMKKTFATRREAEAHIRETKNRVSKIINYHNRANADGASRVNHPPPRRAVQNVGRAAGRRRSTGGGSSSSARAISRADTIRSPPKRRPRRQRTPAQVRRTRASKTESRRLQIDTTFQPVSGKRKRKKKT